MSFQDHFSERAQLYAQYRPTYPANLYETILSFTPGRQRAWDCATGNGQAALQLAPHFEEVIATDGSRSQIQHAPRAEGIVYKVALAEKTPFPDHHFDLITVAQALHWLDLDRFYPEVIRVGRPDAIFAAWTYGLFEMQEDIQTITHDFYYHIVGPYWPPRRKHVMAGYESLAFPFPQFDIPPIYMKARWTLDQMEGYLRTWSATKEYIAKHRRDPLKLIQRELHRVWGNPEHTQEIQWQLALRIGKIS